MPILIPLSRIHDNPYQPRQDYPDIGELADKILALKSELPVTLGLIHPPNARLVDGDGQPLHFPGTLPPDDEPWAVQIAEGHRRLRAFRLLAEKDPDYARMPITILDLDEQTMDDIAWDENKDRKDLSPVEEARALKRSLERFGLTQADLAARRKLGRSTVSNKLRLLQLPDDLLEAIHDGRLSERHGMAYLPAMEIKAADLKAAGSNLQTDADYRDWQTPHPDALRRRLVERGDLTADQVRTAVSRIETGVENAKRARWEAKQRREEEKKQPPPVPVPVSPAPAPPPEPQKLDMPAKEDLQPDLPDVVVTIRLPRGEQPRPATFTLSAGEDGQFPQFLRGSYPDDLHQVLEHALTLFIPPDSTDGEQILMEIEKGDNS